MEVNYLEHALAMIQVLKHSFNMSIEYAGILILVSENEDNQRWSRIVQLTEEVFLYQELDRGIVRLYSCVKNHFT